MTRRDRRKAVRKLVKEVKQSSESEFNIQLPKSSFEYFEKQMKK